MTKPYKIIFSILEDTLIGFHLYGYSKPVRKQLSTSPKFYFIDLGIKRALEKKLEVPLNEASYDYGKSFEHKVIVECYYLNEYLKKDFNFYYLRTKNNLEVDLVVERPGKSDVLIEIKSSKHLQERHVRNISQLKKTWKAECEAQVWSREEVQKTIQDINCLPWKGGLYHLFFK